MLFESKAFGVKRERVHEEAYRREKIASFFLSKVFKVSISAIFLGFYDLIP